MACCLMTPSHCMYLDQCCLIISGVLWYSPSHQFGNYESKITAPPSRGQWAKITCTKPLKHCKARTVHWRRVTHICVSKLTIIGSDNGLSPDRRQAIIWTNAGLLLIGPLGINFSEILIEILTFSFKNMRLKVSSAKRRPFCLGLNVFNSLDALHAWSCNLCRWVSICGTPL